jgi:hypothetical protein
LHEQSKKGKASISVVSRREFVMSRHALLKRVEAVLLTHTCSAGAGADADADEEDMHIAGPSHHFNLVPWSKMIYSTGQ